MHWIWLVKLAFYVLSPGEWSPTVAGNGKKHKLWLFLLVCKNIRQGHILQVWIQYFRAIKELCFKHTVIQYVLLNVCLQFVRLWDFSQQAKGIKWLVYGDLKPNTSVKFTQTVLYFEDMKLYDSFCYDCCISNNLRSYTGSHRKHAALLVITVLCCA